MKSKEQISHAREVVRHLRDCGADLVRVDLDGEVYQLDIKKITKTNKLTNEVAV